jgi:hypothetical protein
MEMGFTEEDIRDALCVTGNNQSAAVSIHHPTCISFVYAVNTSVNVFLIT